MKPIGLEGTARSAMTVSIIVILGVTLAYLLINPGEDKSTVKDVLLILSGAISYIVGFYFGGRAGAHEEMPRSKEAEEAPVPKPVGTGQPTDEVLRPEVEAEKWDCDHLPSTPFLSNRTPW